MLVCPPLAVALAGAVTAALLVRIAAVTEAAAGCESAITQTPGCPALSVEGEQLNPPSEAAGACTFADAARVAMPSETREFMNGADLPRVDGEVPAASRIVAVLP